MNAPDPQPCHSEWLPLLLRSLQRYASVVRVVIAAVRGSAPREAGASMIVTPAAAHGTIGGGRLEWEVLRSARGLLSSDSTEALLQKFVLGPQLGQCCGGVVEVWLERYTSRDSELLTETLRRSQSGRVELRSTLLKSNSVRRRICMPANSHIANTARASLQHNDAGEVTLVELLTRPAALWLYGAGHVGRAVVRIAAELAWQVTWIDSRAEALTIETGGNIQARCAAEPVETVQQAPPDSCFLVMTHSHALDYALCRAILSRDYAWAGLIGSNSKSARFRAQLRRDGILAAQVERLVCPVGIAGIHNKHPTAIAVSVVAQLLQHFQQAMPLNADLPMPLGANCVQSCSGCDNSVVSS